MSNEPPNAVATVDGAVGDDPSSLAGEWEIDQTHSSLEFSIRYAMFTTVRGRFTSFSGAVHIDPSDLSLTAIDVNIDAASVDTSWDARDRHIRGEGFLEVERHPEISFRANSIEPNALARFIVSGGLSIRGVSQPVRLETRFYGQAPDMMGNARLGFHATSRLRRSLWGITWNAPVSGGGVLLADDVELSMDVSLVPAGTLEQMAQGSAARPNSVESALEKETPNEEYPPAVIAPDEMD
jgi:polyisoprenoid-binding protein YceI